MTRLWLFARIYCERGVFLAPPAAVLSVAQHIRAADPAACFFYSRVDDSAGPAFDLWLDSVPEARRDALHLLHAGREAGWRLWTEDGLRRPVRHPHESERDVTDELAAVSTAFALAVPPRSGQDRAFELAMAHLRGVCGFLREAVQRPFLFQCWRQWGKELSSSQRADLVLEAGMRVATAPDEPPAAQRAYLKATQETVRCQRPGSGLPEGYLWFLQVVATHDRLAVPHEVSAAAALTVRNELAQRPDWALAAAGTASGGGVG
jgi:hypothetical protein